MHQKLSMLFGMTQCYENYICVDFKEKIGF